MQGCGPRVFWALATRAGKGGGLGRAVLGDGPGGQDLPVGQAGRGGYCEGGSSEDGLGRGGLRDARVVADPVPVVVEQGGDAEQVRTDATALNGTNRAHPLFATRKTSTLLVA